METALTPVNPRLKRLGVAAFAVGTLWTCLASRMAIPSSRASITPGLLAFGFTVAVFIALPGLIAMYYGRLLAKHANPTHAPAAISALLLILIYITCVSTYFVDAVDAYRDSVNHYVQAGCFFLLTPVHVRLSRYFTLPTDNVNRLSKGWIMLTCYVAFSIGIEWFGNIESVRKSAPSHLEMLMGVLPFLFVVITYKLLRRVSDPPKAKSTPAVTT